MCKHYYSIQGDEKVCIFCGDIWDYYCECESPKPEKFNNDFRCAECLAPLNPFTIRFL